MSKNPNRQGFLNRVEDIRHAEADVDKLLDAARLKRIESGNRRISPLLRVYAMLLIAAVIGFVLWIDFASQAGTEGFLSLFTVLPGIGVICAALFCGHGE